VSLRVVRDVFEVMAQVDHRLTKVNSVDRIIRVNKPGRKPGASQPTPLKQNLDNKITATFFQQGKGYKGGRHTRLHFSIARIQMGQKIHGALLTASTQFMRKRAMDVYMKN
jgi:hypothetical protein